MRERGLKIPALLMLAALQFFCILSAMLLPPGHWITWTLVIAMTVMTVWSGAKYLWDHRETLASGGM